jgi:hypothetical protein
MTINYKFNKSSEARDCVVESVELKYQLNNRELVDNSLHVEILNNYAKTLIGEDAYLLESEEDINDYVSDFHTVIEEEINVEKGFEYYYIEEHLFDDYFVCFEKWIYSESTEIENVKIYKIITETKTFISQQELKDYINIITEPIEFITESDIDQVLMKEWIGEWETKKVLNSNLGNEYSYYETVYMGSPKLNSKWIFKIK